MKTTISNDVLDVLKQSCCEANQLRLPHQLARDLYVKTAKIIELLGFTKVLQVHNTEEDAVASFQAR